MATKEQILAALMFLGAGISAIAAAYALYSEITRLKAELKK